MFDEIKIRHIFNAINEAISKAYAHAEWFSSLESTLVCGEDLTEDEKTALIERAKQHRILCNALIKEVRRKAAELPEISKEVPTP